MSYSNVKKFPFLPEVTITSYFRSNLRDEKWRHESDIDNFLEDVTNFSIMHIVPIEGLFGQEPSYIENLFFGTNQDHNFSYTFEDLVVDYMEKFISSLHISFGGYTLNFYCELPLYIAYCSFKMNCFLKIHW